MQGVVAGDTGGFCAVTPTNGVPAGAPNVNYPASSADIAMDADPNSGANVVGDGPTEVVDGTSFSSLLSLGVWARMETSHGNQLGFAARLLYGVYGSDDFNDIVLGDSGPYPATPGWDFATGLGTFDVSNMNAVLNTYAPKSAVAPSGPAGPAGPAGPEPVGQCAPTSVLSRQKHRNASRHPS